MNFGDSFHLEILREALLRAIHDIDATFSKVGWLYCLFLVFVTLLFDCLLFFLLLCMTYILLGREGSI